MSFFYYLGHPLGISQWIQKLQNSHRELFSNFVLLWIDGVGLLHCCLVLSWIILLWITRISTSFNIIIKSCISFITQLSMNSILIRHAMLIVKMYTFWNDCQITLRHPGDVRLWKANLWITYGFILNRLQFGFLLASEKTEIFNLKFQTRKWTKASSCLIILRIRNINSIIRFKFFFFQKHEPVISNTHRRRRCSDRFDHKECLC